jgi:colanic acid/amylovoran biosynthesis protein
MTNSIIIGGGFLNKGAQAMTFVAIDELTKNFPSDAVKVFIPEPIKQEEYEKFVFDVEFYNIRTLCKIARSVFYFAFKPRKIKDGYKVIKDILHNARLAVDISGFSLSSKWGVKHSLVFLIQILCMHKMHIPVYLFPQSIGPFDYNGIFCFIMKIVIKHVLKYPEIIYVRERDGYTILVDELKLTNVVLCPDMVLLNRSIDLNNIYKQVPKIRDCDIALGSVAIVPNLRTFDHGNLKSIYNLYDKIIDRLLFLNKKVYLLRHSNEDIVICNELKNHFIDNDDVIFFADDFSCVEYNVIVNKFDYLIASMYHSIVHAYKNHVPCVVLGWAVKYVELLSLFDQYEYIFNITENTIQVDMIISAVLKMNENHRNESDIIAKKLAQIQNKNPFDILDCLKNHSDN